MSLIEKWFQQGLDLATKLHGFSKDESSWIDLQKNQKRWSMLLSLLSGSAVNLNLTKTADLWINDMTVSLPRIFKPTANLADNQFLLIYALAMIAIRIKFNTDESNEVRSIVILEKILIAEFSGCQEILEEVERIAKTKMDIRQSLFAKRTANEGIVTPLHPGNQERDSGPRDNVAIATAPKITTVVLDEADENPLLHSFEKTHTAEEFTSGNKQQHDADDLATEQRALEELIFSRVIRTNQTAKSYAESDFLFDKDHVALADTVATAPQIFLYPEWCYRQARHRENWCQVVEDRQPIQGSEFTLSDVARLQAGKLQRFLAGVLNLRRWQRGFCDGPEIDIDAVIRHFATPAEFRDSNGKLFQRRNWATNDVAILLLIDTSLSSDSWVNNKRILDLEKEFLAILASAFSGNTIAIEIAGFNSVTRKWCKYQVLKDFSDDWSGLFSKISGLRPDGYTRLGPIIRHGMQRLAKIPAKKRAIFLLTDARPTDYDAYEGQYGISDVQKAILEARNLEIQTVGFILGNKREKFHEQMFGRGGYHYAMDSGSFLGYFQRSFLALMRG